MKKALTSAIFWANIFVILYFWWQGSSEFILSQSPAQVLVALGRIAGLLAEYFILVELILISRIPFIEREYGFDVLNKYHRWFGYFLGAFILSHPILLTFGYSSLQNITVAHQFLVFFQSDDILNAFIGLLVFIGVIIASLPFIRRLFKYESWHFVHLFMYLAIALAFGHQLEGATVNHGGFLYYWFVLNFAVFGAFGIWRFLKPLVIFNRHRFFIEKIVKENNNVVSIYISGQNMENFKFESGQFLNVIFLNKGFLQPHPFSFSAPYNGKDIRISAKMLGDYTSKLEGLKEGIKVIIEGPLGKFTEKVAKYNKYLLIAGGIGITPIRSLVESLNQKNKDIILIYGVRTPEDAVFKSELEKITNNIKYVFSNYEKGEHESGYIDESKIKKIAPDFKERDIYICGPTKMMESVIKTLKHLGAKSSQIHYEKFSF